METSFPPHTLRAENRDAMPAKKTFHQAAEQKNFLAQYGVNGPLDKQERKQSSPPVKPRGETIFFTDFYHKKCRILVQEHAKLTKRQIRSSFLKKV